MRKFLNKKPRVFRFVIPSPNYSNTSAVDFGGESLRRLHEVGELAILVDVLS